VELPNAAEKLKEFAREEESAIKQAIRVPRGDSAQDARLVAHEADPNLAGKRVSAYEPIVGSDLRCPRCWVFEGKVSLLEETGTYKSDNSDYTKVDRHDQEYEVACAACDFRVLLPCEWEGDTGRPDHT
jgi:hypothetical protein